MWASSDASTLKIDSVALFSRNLTAHQLANVLHVSVEMDPAGGGPLSGRLYWKWMCLQEHKGTFFVSMSLKGSSDAHFTQVDMILYGLNEKCITHFG